MVLALSLTMVACSDEWNDHYEAKTTGNGTMWEIINSDPTLSNFREVIEQCGYSALLDSKQAFTLFAPTNEYFTAEMRDSVISVYNSQKGTRANGAKELRNEAVAQFIYNHLARYKTSVFAGMDTTISMMNGKRLPLTENSLDGCAFEKSNISTDNGVVYYLKTPLSFKSNIYEYITSATNRDHDMDSLNSFLTNKNYCYELFDAKASVAGDIVDGKTQYLDSVTVLYNQVLSNFYGAALNDEDSTYYLVAPTNELWKEKLEKYQQFFKYDSNDNNITKEVCDSLEYLGPRWAMIMGTAFSKTFNTEESLKDSAFSTNAYPYRLRYLAWGSYDKKNYQYDKPYAVPTGIFSGTTEVKCSNGILMKANTLNVPDTMRFMYTLYSRAGYSPNALDSVTTASTSSPDYYQVSSESPFYNKLQDHAYVVISPKSVGGRPECRFNVKSVLSGVKYKVYLLTVPAISGDTLDTNKDFSTKYRVTMKYSYDGTDNKSHDETIKPEGSSVSYVDVTTTTGDVTKHYLGTYKFDYCSFGLDEARIKLLFQSRQTGQNIEAKRIRLSAIIFEPEEE